ncbi:MAG TPA: GspMb/PilO family protein, partial [Steroidobacteraceae bacterium]|nr:GspMb/PilO family protein [Steroidobacteraceae bacterium]
MSLAERCAKLPVASRRVVALLVTPLAIVLLVSVIWLPIGLMRQSQIDWRSEAIDTLSSTQQAPAAQAAMDQQLTAMRSSPLWSRFYKTPDSVSATTALHADLSALLSGAQASVQSLTPIPSEEQSAFTRIGVRFGASMRMNDLQNLLTAMSAHSRYLRVERLVVTAPQMQ